MDQWIGHKLDLLLVLSTAYREGMALSLDSRLAGFGRACFALALAGFGVLSFIYGDIVIGRAPAWPDALPGRLVWAAITGALLLGASVTLLLGRNGRWPLLLSALVVLVWGFLRHLPIVAAHQVLDGSWTAMGKAVALVGGLCTGAATLPDALPEPWRQRSITLGRIALGYFLLQSGIQHFMFTSFVATLVPAWIPDHLFWARLAGVALIAGGAGLLFPPTARLAAIMSGLMIFTWFIILHIPRALSAAGTAATRNEWTAVFEALAFSGIAFMLVRRPPPASPSAAQAS